FRTSLIRQSKPAVFNPPSSTGKPSARPTGTCRVAKMVPSPFQPTKPKNSQNTPRTGTSSPEGPKGEGVPKIVSRSSEARNSFTPSIPRDSSQFPGGTLSTWPV
ncbi:MAG TPA: hypothetical protein VI816_00260, partial [Candidatus Bathyarchaeia archaeon]|nr:hypothetical protein [Candidatus Bathyarchaeia archaeon]